MNLSLSITIEYRDGFYYWVLKDDNGITHDWATSLGGVFEQIIEDRTKQNLTKNDGNKYTDSVV